MIRRDGDALLARCDDCDREFRAALDWVEFLQALRQRGWALGLYDRDRLHLCPGCKEAA